MIKIVLGEVEKLHLNTYKSSDLAQQYTGKGKLEYSNPIPDISCEGMFQNQFVGTLHRAFRSHNAFTLNPDDIWFVILQGLSNHINLNAEKFRGVMVDFEGQKNILIDHNGLVKGSVDNTWNIIFPQFQEKIASMIKDATIADSIVPTFSTTTELDTICFQIALMDICKSYFTYSIRTMCNIPVINVDGTKEDWIKILDTINIILPQFELGEWLGELNVIINKIVDTFEGNIDTKFFNSIYKFESGSGASLASGWVCDLFPYMLNGKEKLVPKVLKGWRGDIGLDTDQFPPSVCSVPFTWIYYGTEYKMNFYAGFIGIQAIDESLRPAKNYFIGYQ